jgi:hypothetical protein
MRSGVVPRPSPNIVDQLTKLKKLGEMMDMPVYFYYAPNTPQAVLDKAAELVGKDNVLPIPPIGG